MFTLCLTSPRCNLLKSKRISVSKDEIREVQKIQQALEQAYIRNVCDYFVKPCTCQQLLFSSQNSLIQILEAYLGWLDFMHRYLVNCF